MEDDELEPVAELVATVEVEATGMLADLPEPTDPHDVRDDRRNDDGIS